MLRLTQRMRQDGGGIGLLPSKRLHVLLLSRQQQQQQQLLGAAPLRTRLRRAALSISSVDNTEATTTTTTDTDVATINATRAANTVSKKTKKQNENNNNNKNSDKNQNQIKGVRGTHTWFPEDAEAHEHVWRTFHGVTALHGYRMINAPVLERAQLFTRTLGAGSDVVTGKEMFSFEDADGTNLCLRPEGTAGVARAVLAAGPIPGDGLRYVYHGPMFRRERPQRGRYRQFAQIGVEHIGEAHVHADVDAIALGQQCLEQLGVMGGGGGSGGGGGIGNGGGITLRTNTLGCSVSRQLHAAALTEYLQSHRDKLSKMSRQRLASGHVLRVLDSKDEGDALIVANAPEVLDYALPQARDRYQQLREALHDLGIEHTHDRNMVRGLDYYGHTVWEFVTPDVTTATKASRTNPTTTTTTTTTTPTTTTRDDDATTCVATPSYQRELAVLAGGRYDGLAAQLGSRGDIPAVGWAAGVERLALLRASILANSSSSSSSGGSSGGGSGGGGDGANGIRKKHSQPPPYSVAVIAAGAADEAGKYCVRTACMSIAHALRRANIRVHAWHSGRPSTQLKRANTVQAARAIIIGGRETEAGVVTLRDMVSGSQVTVSNGKDLLEMIKAEAAEAAAAATTPGPLDM